MSHSWLGRFAGTDGVTFAVEARTSWRFVAEEPRRTGLEPHLADPADTATLRGRKKRAKIDRGDARHLRGLLVQRRLPVAWIPPQHVLEVRTLARLYVALVEERTAWQQRIHVQLHHQGVPEAGLCSADSRAALAQGELSPGWPSGGRHHAGRCHAAGRTVAALRRQLEALGVSPPAAWALRNQFGIGRLPAASFGPSSATVGASATPARWCALPGSM